jgi:hypothetical protein
MDHKGEAPSMYEMEGASQVLRFPRSRSLGTRFLQNPSPSPTRHANSGNPVLAALGVASRNGSSSWLPAADSGCPASAPSGVASRAGSPSGFPLQTPVARCLCAPKFPSEPGRHLW